MRIFRRTLRAYPSRAVLDQEVVSICLALEHIKNHGNLDGLPGTRSHRLALMTTAARQGLVVWNRGAERYELTSLGQQRLGAYGWALTAGSATNRPRRRVSGPRILATAVAAAACISLVAWASPRIVTNIALAIANSPPPMPQAPEGPLTPAIDVPCGQRQKPAEQRNCLGTVGRNIARINPQPATALASLPTRPQIAALARSTAVHGQASAPDPSSAAEAERSVKRSTEAGGTDLPGQPALASREGIEAGPSAPTPSPPPTGDVAAHDNPPADATRASAAPEVPQPPATGKPAERTRSHSANQRRLAQWKRMRHQNEFWDGWFDQSVARAPRFDRGPQALQRRQGNEFRDGLAFVDNDRRSRPGFFSWMFR